MSLVKSQLRRQTVCCHFDVWGHGRAHGGRVPVSPAVATPLQSRPSQTVSPGAAMPLARDLTPINHLIIQMGACEPWRLMMVGETDKLCE